MKHADGTPAFPALKQFVSAMLSLPHSSAAVERVFSAVNLLKTKQRNSLSTDPICGLLHTKRLIASSTCYGFSVEKPLLRRMETWRKCTEAADDDYVLKSSGLDW